jgi:hypothetical protein
MSKGYSVYKTILVTLDGTPSDRTIIEHINQLGQFMHSRLVLLHVAQVTFAANILPTGCNG